MSRRLPASVHSHMRHESGSASSHCRCQRRCSMRRRHDFQLWWKICGMSMDFVASCECAWCSSSSLSTSAATSRGGAVWHVTRCCRLILRMVCLRSFHIRSSAAAAVAFSGCAFSKRCQCLQPQHGGGGANADGGAVGDDIARVVTQGEPHTLARCVCARATTVHGCSIGGLATAGLTRPSLTPRSAVAVLGHLAH